MDRSFFRLRLPWLSAVSASRPASETTVPIQRSTTGSPNQRPPFRPPGRAPIQRPATQSKSQPQPKTEPQLQPKTESQPASQPPSEAKVEPQKQPQPASKSPTQPETKPQPQRKIELQSESQPPHKPKTEPQTQPQPASQPSPLPKTEPQPESKPPTQPETQPQPQPKIEPQSESQPPPQQRNEPQSASLPPPPTQLQVTSKQILPPLAMAQSQPLSPPTLPSPATSQGQFPQNETAQNRGITEPQSPSTTSTRSPSKTPTQSPSKTATQSIYLSPTASRPQPAEETTSFPQSPLRLVSPSDQQSGQTTQLPEDERIPNFPPTIKDVSQPQQGPESVVSIQQTQESKSNTEITAEAIIKFKEQIQSETTTQPQVPTQPQKALGLLTTSVPNALIAPSISKQTEGDKIAEETSKEEETKAPAHKDLRQGIITNLLAATPDSGTQVREAASKAFQAQKKQQQEKQDFQEVNSDTKQMETTTSTNTMRKSQQDFLLANKEVPLQKEIKEDVSKFVNQLVAGQPNQRLGEQSATVITLAGENRGAFMQLAPESEKKEAPIHIFRGYKTNPDESPDATTDGEGSLKGRSSEDPITKQPLTKAYINNNVQSINNSIFFESSVDERNPGVKLSLCQNLEEATESSPKPLETHKAVYKMSPSEKLTFEPTVRRRCLRGLFLETSDSDTENPQKPRRHGCRYDCRKKIKDIEA